MSFDPPNAQQAYLSDTIDIPDPAKDSKLFYEIVNQRERETGSIVNMKEHGVYSTLEMPNCQQWPGATPQDQRNGFRRLFVFPAPLVAGANNQPHGLGALATYTFTRIYGTAQDATVPTFVPLDGMITIGPVNITITVPPAYAGPNWSAQVVLEYLKN